MSQMGFVYLQISSFKKYYPIKCFCSYSNYMLSSPSNMTLNSYMLHDNVLLIWPNDSPIWNNRSGQNTHQRPCVTTIFWSVFRNMHDKIHLYYSHIKVLLICLLSLPILVNNETAMRSLSIILEPCNIIVWISFIPVQRRSIIFHNPKSKYDGIIIGQQLLSGTWYDNIGNMSVSSYGVFVL